MQAQRCPRIRLAWRHDNPGSGFKTGVSLHSHTSHSKETLDFVPRISRRLPVIREVVRAHERQYRDCHGRELDYYAAWWTPPLGPREALALERAQIEALTLKPLVSITDHDNIEAPLLLRVLDEGRDVPVSVEWTVPWKNTFFHLGVHNLPPRRALDRMGAMSAFTANPDPATLAGLLDWLCEDPHALIVFNHPCWDEKGIGAERHCALAYEFLAEFESFIHAVELNGLRPWRENVKNMELGKCFDKPPVSGGDRHTLEPNALINLTNTSTFGEFVDEIREDGISQVLVMPQYREPLSVRVIRGISDVIEEKYNGNAQLSRWTDRVFVRTVGKPARALSAIWNYGKEPTILRLFAALVRFSSSTHVQGALRRMTPEMPELSV